MLSGSAFNALLKTLEEPPAHVVFILATTELHKLPATIISRCQRFDFRRITTEVLKNHLLRIARAEEIELDDSAADLALIYDFDSSWAYHAKSMLFPSDFGPKGSALTYPNYIEHPVYRAIFPHASRVRITPTAAGCDECRVVIAPRHIVWTKDFEDSVLAYIENGGTFLCDTDIFKKNEDNAYLEAQPRLITEVFGLPADLPVEDAAFTEAREVTYGKGKAVMVSRKLDVEAWDALLQKYYK
jgi:hypothetical protein